MNRARILPIVVALALLLVGGLGSTQAQGGSTEALVSRAFTYQGQLNKDGSPVNDTCDMRFALYDAESGGAQVGATLTRTGVSVSEGLFTVSNLDFGSDAFSGDARWLEVSVQCTGDAAYVALTPLQALTAAPYALSLRPGAEVIGAVPTGLSVEANNTGVSGRANSTDGYGVYGFNEATAGDAAGVFGQNNSTDGQAVIGYATAAAGVTSGVWGYSASTSGRGVYGVNNATSGTAYGVYGLSISTAGHGVHGANTATTGTTYGVWGEVDAPNGRAVFGRNNATSGGSEGVYGAVYSPDGRAILGINYAITGTAWGVYGRSDSTDGIGVYGLNEETTGDTYGVYGEVASTAGRGVYGYASAASGFTYGVYGEANAAFSTGVYGVSNGTSGVGVSGEGSDTGVFAYATATTGPADGLFGVAESNEGTGVSGYATATTGQTYGLLGVAESNEGTGVKGVGDLYGVQGGTGSGTGWAGYFATTVGNGVYISAPAGKVGLNVAGGTKNAVVATAAGSRLLYTEESTEVWFTDYGFGQLQDGQATIAIDPLFAQTVNLDEPYHVFLTVLGAEDMVLRVESRGPASFTVVGKTLDGRPASGEFDYRLVAKRLGYEDDRLEPAPWADGDPNLYPEKRAEWEAEHNFGGER